VDLFDVGRACFRRWYVLLPLLLVTLWVSHSAYTSVKPVYYSNAVIGLAPPSNRIDQGALGEPVPRNGLLDIGGATMIANMTAVGLRQPAVEEQVVAGGGQAGYNAELFPVPVNTPPVPIILIEETTADPSAATKTLELVIANTAGVVQNLQQQALVPADQMLTSFVVAPPSPPAAGMPKRTQATVAMFLAGAGLSILITVLVDVLLTRLKIRVQKRRKKRQLPAEAEAGTDPTNRRDDVREPDEATGAKAVVDAT
jgi:hypothetical protein